MKIVVLFALVSGAFSGKVEEQVPVDNLSMQFPLYTEMFDDWQTKGTSVFLDNKLVLNPEGQELYGLTYSSYIFQKNNWEMNIDLEISNKRKSSNASGSTKIYLIKNNPEANPHTFAYGLQKKYRGLMIQITENSQKHRAQSSSQSSRAHMVTYKYLNDDGSIMRVAKNVKSSCNAAFRRGLLRFISNKEKGQLDLFYRDLEREGAGLEFCLTLPVPIDYPTYTFFSTNSGKGVTNAHFLHSVKFYDLDNPIYVKDLGKDTHTKFIASQRDILHMSNQNSRLAEDQKLGMVAYNNEVLKYNDLYSELLGKFISNQVLAEQILESLPTFPDTFAVEKAAVFYESDQNQLLGKILEAQKQIKTTQNKASNQISMKIGDAANGQSDQDSSSLPGGSPLIETSEIKLAHYFTQFDQGTSVMVKHFKDDQLSYNLGQVNFGNYKRYQEAQVGGDIGRASANLQGMVARMTQRQTRQLSQDDLAQAMSIVEYILVVAFILMAAYGVRSISQSNSNKKKAALVM